MKEYLSNKGIAFQEIDVAADQKARAEMMNKTGRMAVPTITVGNDVVVGFNRSELENLLS